MAGSLAVALIVILFMIFTGVAMPFSFLSGCLVYAFMSGESMAAWVQTSFKAINSYSIIAMPMFMIAGTMIERSGIAGTLIRAAQKMVGRLKGGMAMTIPVVACFFGALSGSGTATCTTLSSMMVPDLEKTGYKRAYLAALIASSASLGYMIPPNANAIIFNSVASESNIAELFMATVIPGLIWAVGICVIIRLTYSKYYTPMSEEAQKAEAARIAARSPEEVAKETKKFRIEMIAAIGMPLIVLGGIYGGIFTATEGGAISCLYALLIGFVVFRKFTLKRAYNDFVNTGMGIGTLMILFPMTYIFSRILVLEQVPASLTKMILSVSDNRLVIIALIDLILFLAGFFVDCSVLQLVFVPLLLPICKNIGVSVTQLAVIMFVCIGVGTTTPPMAMNIFLSARILKLETKDVIKPIWPFVFGIGIPMIILVSYIPAMSEWLPSLIM